MSALISDPPSVEQLAAPARVWAVWGRIAPCMRRGSPMLSKAASEKVGHFLDRFDRQHLALLIAGTALALLLRISLLDFKSNDFLDDGRAWYYQIQVLGFRAFGHDLSNANLPYLYLLYLIARFIPHLPNLTAVKLPALVADFVCATFVYQIVRFRRESRSEALLAYMALLLAPAIVLNGSFWGQPDSLCAAAVAVSLFGVLKKKPWVVTTAYGAALAFGLPAIFLLPFLISLSLKRRLGWKHWLAVPTVLVAGVLPAWVAGRPISGLVLSSVVSADYSSALSTYAPTLYTWVPTAPDAAGTIFHAGLVFALLVMAVLVVLMARSRVELSPQLAVQLATLCVVLVPFVTPKMHERDFLLADVLSIVLAFYVPSLYHLALVTNMSSLFSYISSLFSVEYHRRPFPEAWLAVAMLLVIALTIRHVVQQLYPALAARGHEETTGGPAATDPEP